MAWNSCASRNFTPKTRLHSVYSTVLLCEPPVCISVCFALRVSSCRVVEKYEELLRLKINWTVTANLESTLGNKLR